MFFTQRTLRVIALIMVVPENSESTKKTLLELAQKEVKTALELPNAGHSVVIPVSKICDFD